jgi:hypothetical protein
VNAGHILYRPSDPDIPRGFAELVITGGLAICRHCWRGEAELDEPCTAAAQEDEATASASNPRSQGSRRGGWL